MKTSNVLPLKLYKSFRPLHTSVPEKHSDSRLWERVIGVPAQVTGISSLKTKTIIGALLLSLLALTFRIISANAGSGQLVDPSPQIPSELQVTLRAASGVTIPFKTKNGRAVDNTPTQLLELPHLVLYRNGKLTPPEERTLSLSLTGIDVPPPGVTVTLKMESQHGDPDLGGGEGNRITVWQASQWFPNTSTATQTNITVDFEYDFRERISTSLGSIPTPTDYFRYEITIIDRDHPITNPRYIYSQDYAFLMENQWIAPLPELGEETAGAAPDELIVYYCDMFPFQMDVHNPSTWLRREEIHAYVGHGLVPAISEAVQLQTELWGFSWHQAWTGYRSGGDADRLSVALADGRTWFHSKAPTIGHAGISIKTKAGYGERAAYASLTEKLLSVFHHELFHNLQRGLAQHSSGNGDVDGAQNAWRFFSEGTAVLASSVAQPTMQFSSASGSRDYISNANNFLVEDLKTTYADLNPYHAALYWRFLYEQCGGMANGLEDPAAGMQVIKGTIKTLYAKEIVDISASTDIVSAFPAIMDRALQDSACPFKTYEQSLTAFARTIYALQLADGRCTEPDLPNGCGFYDPNNLYAVPEVRTITYTGTTESQSANIPSSFGIDLVDVILDPAADGKPLTLSIFGLPEAEAQFNVQIWKLNAIGEGFALQRFEVVPETLKPENTGGHLVFEIPQVDTSEFNRLALIITRVDNQEDMDPIGKYSIILG